MRSNKVVESLTLYDFYDYLGSSKLANKTSFTFELAALSKGLTDLVVFGFNYYINKNVYIL